MRKPENIYDGIVFYPMSKKFSAAITKGGNTYTIGFFDSLKEAINARRDALQSQARKR